MSKDEEANLGLRVECPDELSQFKAALPRHAHIEDDAVKILRPKVCELLIYASQKSTIGPIDNVYWCTKYFLFEDDADDMPMRHAAPR